MIRISRLKIGYEKVLRGSFDLELEGPALVGIIGPNGSGKSTFLKTVCGISPSLGGEIEFSGENIGEMASKKRSRTISLVSSENFDPGHYTVWDILSFGRYPYLGVFPGLNQSDHDKIMKTLNELKLSSLAKRYFRYLSQGERQRVLIGRALCQDTPFLFLDEPLSHLDPPFQVETLDLLRQYHKRQGKTIFWVSHFLRTTLLYADFLLILKKNGENVFMETELAVKQGLVSEAFDKKDMFFNPHTYHFELKQKKKFDRKCLLVGNHEDIPFIIRFLEKNSIGVHCFFYKEKNIYHGLVKPEKVFFSRDDMDDRDYWQIIVFDQGLRFQGNAIQHDNLKKTLCYLKSKFN